MSSPESFRLKLSNIFAGRRFCLAGTVLKCAWRAQVDSVEPDQRWATVAASTDSSGRTLTLVQEERLRLKIIGSNPALLQLEFALWNRRAVMLAIKQLFDIEMPIRTFGEYLRRWGFMPQRPVKCALEQDPPRLKAWLEDECPKIVAGAKAEYAEIYWGDETAIRQNSNWAHGYSIPGLTPELRLSAGRHGSTSTISPITNQGLVRFSFFEGAIDAERFIVFWTDLIQDAQRKVFLIVANLCVHRANRVREWAIENAEKIDRFYLPPYAPKLNPDEYLNQDLKTLIRFGPIGKTATALLEKARECMKRIAAMPDRVLSYFSHEFVLYAQQFSYLIPRLIRSPFAARAKRLFTSKSFA